MRTSLMGRIVPLALALLLTAGFVLAGDINKLPPDNWQPAGTGRMHLMTDATSPRPFIGLPPCRIVDTRGNGAPIQGGAFGTDEVRTWTIAGICGLPVGTDAVSLNITATGTGFSPFGYVKIWPAGGVEPNVSTLNWNQAGQTIANAAIVPLGGGGISLRSGNAGSHIIVDVNGYFSDVLGSPGNYFQLTTNSSGYTAFLQNLSTTCGGACGLYQSVGSGIAGYFINGSGSDTGAKGVYGGVSSTATGATGVYGLASAATGTTRGVLGQNSSTTSGSSGVYGSSGSPGFVSTLNGNTGVIGLAAGATFSTGVFGIATGFGVAGTLVNSAGTIQSYGYLGYSSTDGIYTPYHLTAVGGKSFVEPHPTDSAKVIKYVCAEGPEQGTYFRGKGRFSDGKAVIEVPEDFRIVSDGEGLTVQITPIGDLAMVAVTRIGLDSIEVKSNRNVEFSYMVNGVRKAYKDWKPIQDIKDNPYFTPESADARLPSMWPEEIRQRLISNGTYDPDGKVNMRTAERMGWAQVWREEAAASRAAQEKSASK
jgi:hypothetical protein